LHHPQTPQQTTYAHASPFASAPAIIAAVCLPPLNCHWPGLCQDRLRFCAHFFFCPPFAGGIRILLLHGFSPSHQHHRIRLSTRASLDRNWGVKKTGKDKKTKQQASEWFSGIYAQ
jgi:hypothetical protein